MVRVQINPKLKVGLDEILNGIAQLDKSDVEYFLKEVSNVLAQKKASNFSKREAELLLKINDSWTTDKWRRYQSLGEKLQAETMSEKEYEEYMILVDEKQDRAISRLKNIIELAALRKVSVSVLSKELGIDKPTA